MFRWKQTAAIAAVVVGAFGHIASAQTVRYVRADAPPGGNGSSWATAHRNLQEAMFGPPGTTVWVARGTYRPSTSSIQLMPNISIYGGFAGNETSLDQRDPDANPTILSGDVMGDDDSGGSTGDNVTVLIAPPPVFANTVVDGFTIRSGRGGQGGGLRCLGSPTISNCHFTRNNTDLSGAMGAAIYIQATGNTSPRLINCRFTRNGNQNGSVTGVVLAEGFGLEVRMVGCSFIANSSTQMGIVCMRNGASATMVNCTVMSNTFRGTDSAAVVLGPSSPSSFLNLINCTIAANTNLDVGQTGGVRIVTPFNQVLVRNSVIWGNVASQTPVERAQISFPGKTYRFDYCRIEGWSGQYDGKGTNGEDPMLMDLDGPDDRPGTGDEDPRLQPGSPCIDAGNNFYVWNDITDVDGDGDVDEVIPFDAAGGPRFLDDPDVADSGVGKAPIVDIGAYESAGSSEPCSADFNNDGVTNSQDFFDFLLVFFRGCR